MVHRSSRVVFHLLLILALILPLVPSQPIQAAQQPANQAKQLESSDTFTLALREDGSVWAWGMNDAWQLGNGSTDPSMVPVRIPITAEVEQIAIGRTFGLALDKNGDVWIWGSLDGNITDNNGLDYSIPVQMNLSEPIVAIAAGESTAYALTEDGHVYSWGKEEYGQLGQGPEIGEQPEPDYVLIGPETPLEGIELIASAAHFALAVDVDGKVYAWGGNMNGGLGNGNIGQYSDFAVQVPGLSGIDAVYAGSGGYSVFAATVTGIVYGWGDNTWGNLGVGHDYKVTLPVMIEDLSGKDVKQISTSYLHTLVLLEDGTVLGSGFSSEGALGDGLYYPKRFEVVTELEGAESISTGPLRSFARISGEMHGMGSNVFSGTYMGALGTGYEFAFTNRPWKVTELAEYIEIGPKPPVRFRVTQSNAHTFTIDYELAPFTSADVLVVDVYEMENGTEPYATFTESIQFDWLTRSWQPVELSIFQPGTYFFRIYTQDGSEVSSSATENNDGEGYVVDGANVSLYITDANGAAAHQYTVILEPLDHPSLAPIEQLSNEGQSTFTGLLPGNYLLSIFDYEREHLYYSEQYYLGLVRDAHFDVRLWTSSNGSVYDVNYRIDGLYFVKEQFDPDSGQLAGELQWNKIEAEAYIDAYHIYWYDKDGNIVGDKLGTVPADGQSYFYQFPMDVSMPDDAIGLAVLLAAGEDEIDTGARHAIRTPTIMQQAWMTDADPRPGIVRRTVHWNHLMANGNFSHYVLRFEDDWTKIAEIEANGQTSYSLDFEMTEFSGNTMKRDLVLAMKYPWGEEVWVVYLLRAVDNVQHSDLWTDSAPDEEVLPPDLDEDSAFFNVSDNPDFIEGWISWQTPSGSSAPVTSYEIVFLDHDYSYLGSIIRVYASQIPINTYYQAYIPDTAVPEGAAYLGIYSRYDYENLVSHMPAVISLSGQGGGGQEPGGGQEQGDGQEPGPNPTEGNRIQATEYGILDDAQSAITHIPKSVLLTELTAGLTLHPAAEVKSILYGSEIYSPGDWVPVQHGMQMLVEDGNGQYRIYTLLTLAGILDGGHNQDGKVDVADAVRFLFEKPVDLNGDGLIDRRDIEMLLEEIEPVVILLTS